MYVPPGIFLGLIAALRESTWTVCDYPEIGRLLLFAIQRRDLQLV
jgi:hypothetical protein